MSEKRILITECSEGGLSRAEVIQKLYEGYKKAAENDVFTIKEGLAWALDEVLYGKK